MNWKKEIKASDLDAGTQVEVTCRKCRKARYTTPAELLAMPGMKNAYLDEYEAVLRCRVRFCGGHVRLALIYDDKTEGFVGGMA